MEKRILSIKNLKIRFKNSRKNVIENINLKLNSSDCLVITGKIGSGKSTLLRAIAKQFPSGLLQEVHGELVVQNNPIVVYQRPSSQILTFRVDEEIATSLSFKQIPRKLRLELVTKYMKKYNITHFAARDPRILSSGEQQSLVILASLVDRSNEQLILLDEPLSLLDQDNQRKVLDIIKLLLASGNSVIIVDHNPIVYTNIANRLLILNQGKSQYLGSYNEGITIFNKILNDIDGIINIKNDSEPRIWHFNASIGYSHEIRRIDLKFPDKGMIMVYGPNGSGKTVFLRTICAYQKAISGSFTMPKDFIFLGQDTFSFFWHKQVINEWPGNELPKWIKPKQHLSPFLLSEGERKKFAIEISLQLNRPLLLDEPSQGLDIQSIPWLFQELLKASKTRLVIITSNDKLIVSKLSKLTNFNISFHKIGGFDIT